MIRRWTCALLCLAVALMMAPTAFALSGPEHNQILEQVLFGDSGRDALKTAGAEEKLDALETAVYLCLDQHNAPVTDIGASSDQLRLSGLVSRHPVEWRLYGLPTSIDEITFGGNDHRRYTHKGWNYDYRLSGVDKANWPRRKALLQGTACLELGFSCYSLFGGFDPERDPQCDAFCQLLFCVHLLGDHEEAIAYHEYNDQARGAFSEYEESDQLESLVDLVQGIIDLGDDLFDQSASKWRTGLRTRLVRVRDHLSRVGYRAADEDEFQTYTESFAELMELLQDEIPGLLKEETFFKKAFLEEA